MITWHIGKKVELTESEIICAGDDKQYLSEYYNGTENGHEKHDVVIGIGKDGSVNFYNSSNDNYIYLYPEQVEHLEKILEERKKRMVGK